MLKPNSVKLAASADLKGSVAAFLAAGGSVTKIEKPGVGSGIKRRKYLVGQGVYGVSKKNTAA